ncbi:MAG: glucose 1-dehydrogenase [Alphaproteobacteria bacterium]|nr:MAG: glucose 1-dehydrogenase [Alphaproteobacteria bacterium]
MVQQSGRVQGKAALVTGAASGLGAAIARCLAREGARVAVADINADGAEAIAREIGEDSLAITLDVTDEASWQKALDATVDALGGLHILVNNAGILIKGTVEELSFEEWRRVHSVDLDGVFLGCKYAIAPMGASGGGSIVNISSISGIIGGHNLAAYNSAKAGVRLLTKSVALHCARAGNNIRCNSVHPTFVDTPMLDDVSGSISQVELRAKLARQIPIGRLGTPEDVALGVLYLASDESSFMTGAELVLDGGVSAM